MIQASSHKLLRNRGKIASRSIEHLLNRRPELKKSLNRPTLLKMHSDLTNSIAHLSGSIVAEDPELFHDHIKWTESYYVHRGLKPEILPDLLSVLNHSITECAYAIGDNTPSEFIRSGIEWLRKHRIAPTADEENPVCPEGYTFAAILLEDDLEKARAFIDDLIKQKWNVEEIVTDVVQAALSEIGSKWHTNHISSKREHAASKISRTVILDLLINQPKSESINGKCALYSPSGELHNLGITIFGELLKNQGIEVHKFGPNIRDSEFITCLQTIKPDALAISITMASDLAHLALILTKIRQTGDLEKLPIVVGGYLAGKLKSKNQLAGIDIIRCDLQQGINTIKKAIQVENVTKSAYSSH